MALEDKIEELIAAIKENTAAVKGGASAPAKESKPSSSGKAPEKKRTTTIDQVAKAFGSYLSTEGDKGKAAVRKIIAHFGVGKVSEIDEDSFDEALALLKKFQDGEDPFGEDGEEEDLM